MTTVNIRVTDFEPFRRFIGKVAEAHAHFTGLSAEEVQALPAGAVAGATALADALGQLSCTPASPITSEGGG